ncbi:hypothetical protein J4E90_000016 [Alternaria incomplexa]|uniref:uncharacterized protein n=1 Tax=Alternaria incomplexa TaxID=1187928 RepID=UPI00221F945D|nr:uncharacterized protein J4E90_000016 [Alternaria incomplexa]KAI4921590.1 hypothetical protein J4E90_000016 [Alternaria incomplexa]
MINLAAHTIMSTAKGYHNALLALSGNPVFAAARDTLLASISDNELLDVITYGLKTGSPRETLNAIATRLLDGLARARNADDAAAPVEGKHGGDDGGDDDEDSGGGGGVRKSGRGGKPKAQEVKITPRKRAPPKPAQTPTSQGTPSSTTNKIRTGDCLMQDGKKRRNASPEPMDDDEDFFKAESVEEEEVAKVPAKKVIKKPSTEAPATKSKTTASSSTTKETDSNVNTSSEDDAMWKEIQKLSVIRDLQLVNSKDTDGKQKNGDGKQANARVVTSSINKPIRIPDVEVRFMMPHMSSIPSNAYRGTMDVFPLSFVKEFVRNFNRDYLVGEKKRTAFRDMIDQKFPHGSCVHCVLNPGNAQGCHCSVSAYSPNRKNVCDACLGETTLYARSEEWANHDKGPGAMKIVLTVYPNPQGLRSGIDWRNMRFWVGTRGHICDGLKSAET